MRRGDVDAGMAAADLIVENTYKVPFIDHAYIEPEAGVAWVDEQGVINIQVCTQVVGALSQHRSCRGCAPKQDSHSWYVAGWWFWRQRRHHRRNLFGAADAGGRQTGQVGLYARRVLLRLIPSAIPLPLLIGSASKTMGALRRSRPS